MNIKKPIISMVVAIAEKNRAIGRNNKLMWNIPEDLLRFKKITLNHPIIMGRKTFESIGRPLPNRTNIIITRNKAYTVKECIVVNSLQKAIEAANKVETEEIFIIGGGEIFKEALPITDKLYLTLVHGDYEGDVFFPDYSEFKTVLFQQEHESNGYKYTYIDATR